jgi:hypothetical protein
VMSGKLPKPPPTAKASGSPFNLGGRQ